VADDRADLIRQVKEANDIVDVVGSYLALRPAGKTFKGLCPFHEDSRPSLDVDPQRQRYRCWACNKVGDVISFVQEHDRVSFNEALELLGRRAGISLEKNSGFRQNSGRAFMLDTLRWAAEQFQKCLLDSPLAEAARCYLGERKLAGDTLRRFGVGFAPPSGDWLVRLAQSQRIGLESLEKVGLVAKRQEGDGWYDRFRDRVIFPIRDARGQPLGFGGRILPSSPQIARGAPKYYNSAETEVFSKSEMLYGLDHARSASDSAGYLAVVEGYTDVLMAHQTGIGQVVATMGTALNSRHVQRLRRFADRIVLVFDADAGGDTGVDRALQIFASQEVDLRIATLPEGKDPCDLLMESGPELFRQALTGAADALEFKLQQAMARTADGGVEGRRRAVDEVLGVIALAPEMPGQSGAIKQQLIITRIAQRLGLKEEMLWARLEELRKAAAQRKPAREIATSVRDSAEPEAPKQAPAAPVERDLLQVLLAEPELIPQAQSALTPDQVIHPGLRRMLEGMYDLHTAGKRPDLDNLRPLLDNPRLAELALRWQEIGRMNDNRPAWLARILEEFRKRRVQPVVRELHNRLQAATDHAQAVELLRRLQNPTEVLDGED
jgi:DNA primase